MPCICLGTIELQNNNAVATLGLMDRAIAVHPDPALFYNRGVALHALKRFDEAMPAMISPWRAFPIMWKALNNRGIVLRELVALRARIEDRYRDQPQWIYRARIPSRWEPGSFRSTISTILER